MEWYAKANQENKKMNKGLMILSISALCMLSVADTVNFTAGEGYSAGALNNHADWAGYVNYTVDPSGTGTALPVAVDANKQITFQNGIASSATTLEVSTQFRFTVTTASYAAGARAVMGVQFEAEAGKSQTGLVSDDVRAFILKTGVVTYQLVLNDLTAGLQQFKPLVFSDDLIGIFGGGEVTDLLELKLMLNRGVDENDWTASASLFNMDTGLMVSETLGNAIDTPAAYFNSTLYGGVFSGSSDSSLSIIDREFETFTVIPEPATLGLIGFLSTGLLVIRRFLSV